MGSVEYIKNVLNESLSNLNEEMKSAYGSSYIEEAKRIFCKVFECSSTDVQLVYNAIESAISLQNPAEIYKPARNIYVKIVFAFSSRVPKVLSDWFYTLILCYMGLPTPRKGINIFLRIFRM